MTDDEKFEASLVDVYSVEARDHMAEIERTILSIDLGKNYFPLIDKVFRLFHSVKGGAFATGLENIGRVAHSVETILETIRENQSTVTQEMLDILLEGCDSISSMLASKETGYGASENTQGICDKLANVLQNKPVQITEQKAVQEEDIEYEIFGAKETELKKEVDPEPIPATASHANAPSTIRMNVALLNQLMRLAGELVLVRNQQFQIMDRSNPAIRANLQRLDAITGQIQEHTMRARMQPISNLVSKIPRIVRDLSRKLHKKIHLSIDGDDVELDKTILESLTDPLLHVIRNCCDHGIEAPDVRKEAGKKETGTVTIRSYHDGGHIKIEIEDDGQGISLERIRSKVLKKGLMTETELTQLANKDILELIFLPGFSTADAVTELSGRGVGMDIVRDSVEQISGTVEVVSQKGRGSTFIITVPLTLAIIPCLFFRAKKQKFALPQANIVEIIHISGSDELELVGNREIFRIRDRYLPVLRLKEILEASDIFDEDTYDRIVDMYHGKKKNHQETSSGSHIMIVRAGARWFGLLVDEVIGSEDIVVSSMHDKVKHLGIYAGSTLSGDGAVSLILDPKGISELSGLARHEMGLGFVREALTGSPENESMLVMKRTGRELFALAKSQIKRVERIRKDQIKNMGKQKYFLREEKSISLAFLEEYLDTEPIEYPEELYVVILKGSSPQVGIPCTHVVDHMGDPILSSGQKVPGVEGGRIINGEVALVLDVPFLLSRMKQATEQDGVTHE